MQEKNNRRGQSFPLKAITFLGTADYKSTMYVYTDGEGKRQYYTTPYFAEALVHFYPDLDEVIMLVTPTVEKHPNVRDIQQRIGDKLTLMGIRESHTEADLWSIFDVLTDAVGEEDRVIFDITSSLRSLPFLTFLAAAYLRTARRIKVEAVLYGAFEAGGPEHNETPVFNLTPFVSLLDWLTATNQFIYTGDAKYLAQLLDRAGKERGSHALTKAGRELESLSLAMMLCRPVEVMSSAGKLQDALTQAQADLDEYTRPFGLLAQRIRAEYAGRALDNPTDDANVQDSLRQQIALIKWYLDNNQIMQGVTLAREWLITAVGWRLSGEFSLTTAEREQNHDGNGIGRGISGLTKLGGPFADRRFEESDLNAEGHTMHGWPEWEQVRDLGRVLKDVRNELDHAGMNRNPTPAATLSRKAQTIVWPQLKALAQLWDLLP